MHTLAEWNAENPFPFYQNMRNSQPIYKDSMQRWNVFRYEDVKRILSDSENFSSQVSFEPMSLLFMDSPEHQQYRSKFAKAMTPQLMGRLAEGIARTTKEAVREFIEQEKTDVVDAISLRVPLEAIASLLGFKKEDNGRFKEWAKFLFWHHAELDQSMSEDEFLSKQEMLTEQVKSYLSHTIDVKRTQPEEDLISALIRVQESSDFVTREDVEAFCYLLLVGGIETSVNLITHSLTLLGDSPDLFARFQANPEEVSRHIEEVLRFRSPVQSVYRVAATHVQLGEHSIRRGEPIVVWIGSANHDERVFEQPEQYNVDRTNNQQHLAFSYGSHYCMGAHLARMEAKIVIAEIIASCEQITNLPHVKKEPIDSTVTFGYESFPMRFVPAPC